MQKRRFILGRHSRPAAFTLVEIITVISLMAIIMAVGLLNFGTLKGKSAAQGMSMVITDQLRRVRQEAVAHNRPTAFCIPTGGGAVSHSQSFYTLEGQYNPRITSTNSYKTEFNDACMYVGKWGPVTAPLPVPAATKWTGFNVANWLASMSPPATPNPSSQDICFIFLPDGSVRTNGQPAFDGNYHIVVAAGVNYDASGISQVGEAFTISISGIGGIECQGGLLKAGPSVNQVPGSVNAQSGMVDAPQVTPIPAFNVTALPGNPVISPAPSVVPPPGISAYVRVGQFVSLSMTCRSDSGDTLFCSYLVSRLSGVGDSGSFSSPAGPVTLNVTTTSPGTLQSWNTTSGVMQWMPNVDNGAGQKGAWVSTWHWTPPLNAQPGDQYQVSAMVLDVATGQPRTVAVPQNVTINYPGNIFFETDRNHSPAVGDPAAGQSGDVFSMDESGNQQTLFRKDAVYPTADLKGSRIAWVDTTTHDIVMAYRQSPTRNFPLNLPASYGPITAPSLNPGGNWLAFYGGSGGKHIYVMKAYPYSAGSNVPLDIGVLGRIDYYPDMHYPNTLHGIQKMCWGPDGKTLMYTADSDGDVYVQPFKNLADPTLNGPPTDVYTPTAGVNYAGAPCWGVDNRVFTVQNDGPSNDPFLKWFTMGYSPYAMTTTANSYHYTVNLEELMPERNPSGGPVVLEGYGSVDLNAPVYGLNGFRYIIKSDTTLGGGAVPDPAPAAAVLTKTDGSQGNCLRPVWTHP